jgi:hypothetical protein
VVVGPDERDEGAFALAPALTDRGTSVLSSARQRVVRSQFVDEFRRDVGVSHMARALAQPAKAHSKVRFEFVIAAE